MRFRISALLITGIFVMLFLSCEMGNNEAEIELSKKRRAEISELERQIMDIDAKISHEIRVRSCYSSKNDAVSELVNSPLLKSLLSDSSGSDLMQGRSDSKISKLKSKREILIIKLRVLYKIEQEYQSKK